MVLLSRGLWPVRVGACSLFGFLFPPFSGFPLSSISFPLLHSLFFFVLPLLFQIFCPPPFLLLFSRFLPCFLPPAFRCTRISCPSGSTRSSIRSLPRWFGPGSETWSETWSESGCRARHTTSRTGHTPGSTGHASSRSRHTAGCSRHTSSRAMSRATRTACIGMCMSSRRTSDTAISRSAFLNLCLAPSPTSNTDANQQDHDAHTTAGNYRRKPFSQYWENDCPNSHREQSACHSRQEAVSVWL